MDLKLKGKQVFITGGSVGIGLAVAQAFAREKATVIIGARNKDRVEHEAQKITQIYSVETLGIAMDVTKPEDIIRSEKEIVRRFGGGLHFYTDSDEQLSQYREQLMQAGFDTNNFQSIEPDLEDCFIQMMGGDSE